MQDKKAYRLGTECNSGTRTLKGDVTLRIDGTELQLVPFVQNLVRNNVLAVVQELEGYEAGARIEVVLE